MRELFNNPKEEEYLSEFKQKVAQEMQDDIEQRRHDLESSRNGFIGALAGIVVAGLVSWFFLLPHFGFHQTKEIPIIRRPVLPVKIQPNEPGGMEIQNQDKTVYALVEKTTVVETKVESLLPPPERPKMPEIAPEEAETIEPAIASQDVQNIDELIEAVQTTATEKVKIPEKLPVIDVQLVKTSEPLTVKTPQEEEQKTLEKQPEPVKEQVKEEAPKVEPKAVAKPAGTWCIQMMASSKKEAVENGYVQLKKQYPVIEGVPYNIESGIDGLTRLKVGAFASKQEAEDLCIKVKAAGGTCMVKDK